MESKTPLLSAAIAVITATSFTACESPRSPGEGARTGAIVGAAAGAISHGTLRGAATGAAIGAGAGALLGKLARDDYRDRYYDERRYDRGYPYARPTNRRGFVTSPYRPHNLIDVRGVPRGAQVVDPSTERIFINP